MRVIGTAGHVDHGKSTLIHALTGIDPDRLREEKERGMTIDLGFAWLGLPSGQEVSIVDVPGHERFIKNMLAGVGGVDIALLVIAADEGVMPQTREHLAILDLLGIDRGVVAITKRDLVDDDWLELVKAEIEETLAGTSLASAPLIAVSSTTGEGLEALRAEMDRLLTAERHHRQTGWPRLPVDRVFTVPGFGTVVTGTLIDGELRAGQEVEIVPPGRRARIRGLQSHQRRVDLAPAGTRVAVNLSGVATEEIRRGDVLTAPGWLSPTPVVDARLRVINDAPRALAHNTQVTFHTGAAEALGRVSLLDRAELPPGESGWAQIRLNRPLAVARADLFIVRLPSPSTTIGGGSIVDEHPKRHRRYQTRVIAQLGVLERGSPEEVLVQTLQSREPAELAELAKRSAHTVPETVALVLPMARRGAIVALETQPRLATPAPAGPPPLRRRQPANPSPVPEAGRSEGRPSRKPTSTALGPSTLLISALGWDRMVAAARTELDLYHGAHRLRRGMPREELRVRLGHDARVFARVEPELITQGIISQDGPFVRLPRFRVTLSPDEERWVEGLTSALAAAGASPPSRGELHARHHASDELIQALIDRGVLVDVGPDLVYVRETYDEIVAQIMRLVRETGTVTVGQVRDAFSTSRKYALALLEHLDQRKVTKRIGDERVLA